MDSARSLRLALALNGAFLLVELTLGLVTGSLALLADAAHMLGDVGAIVLALAAIVVARKPAGSRSTFGQRRVQVMAGLVNAVVLFVAGIFIGRAAIVRLIEGAGAVPALPVLIAGAVGLLINVVSALHLHRHAHAHDVNARAALWHMVADALGSVGAIVAAVMIWLGVREADAVVGLLVAAVVLMAAVRLAREAVMVLMQYAPSGMHATTIREALLEVEGIDDVHDLHVWSVDGRTSVLTAHLVGDLAVRVQAERVLRDRFGIDHTTLQVDPDPCCTIPCALESLELLDPPKHTDVRGHGHQH